MAYSRAVPPSGYSYATQPNVEPAAGDSVPVTVAARRDQNCPVAAASVTVQAREVGRADFRTVRTGSTNQQGYATFTVKPVRLTELRATVTSGSDSATSSVISVAIRRAVTAAYSSPGGCRVAATGSVYPRAAAVPVRLQRRIVRDGKELGFVTLTETTTASDGTYRAAYRATCGADYALVTYVPALDGTAAGRALFVDLHVAATP
ncbi:MAG: hypothetical protein LC789_17270 [Actinobacteria bacterium]|nr:hypothetical protein [Actinomycetota bacterium]